MEGDGERREEAVLRRAGPTQPGASRDLSRLQVPAPTQTVLHRQRQEDENLRVQGRAILIYTKPITRNSLSSLTNQPVITTEVV